MPVITLEGPSIPDPAKRRKMVDALTSAAAGAYGLPKEKIIILIRENAPDQVAVGGVLLTDRT